MTKLAALALVAATLLAGCGVAPTASPLGALKAHAPQSRALDAEKRRVELRVPARVMGYVDAYAADLKREYGQEMERDMYGRPMYPKYTVKLDRSSREDVKVVASADGFKTTFDENGYNAGRRQDGTDVLVPFVAPPGSVKYYLEVTASVTSTATGKLVKRLPVHYISNMGANFDGRFELEK